MFVEYDRVKVTYWNYIVWNSDILSYSICHTLMQSAFENDSLLKCFQILNL